MIGNSHNTPSSCFQSFVPIPSLSFPPFRFSHIYYSFLPFLHTPFLPRLFFFFVCLLTVSGCRFGGRAPSVLRLGARPCLLHRHPLHLLRPHSPRRCDRTGLEKRLHRFRHALRHPIHASLARESAQTRGGDHTRAQGRGTIRGRCCGECDVRRRADDDDERDIDAREHCLQPGEALSQSPCTLTRHHPQVLH